MTRHVRFRGFRGADFQGGTHQGTRGGDGALAYGASVGVAHHQDAHREGAGRQAYTWAAWLSPEVRPGFGFTELVPSWNARTPDDSWLVVEARVSVDGARWSRWHCLAEWAETDDEVHRSSRVTSPGPGEDGSVDVDVLQAVDGVAWTAYQLRLTLLRRPGSDAEPQVRLLGAMVSSPGEPAPASPGGAAWGVELAVPEHSQQLHRDTFPQYAGGGEAWCSPSSTAMVLETFDLGPRDKDYAWVPQDATDPTVVHAARSVYDHGYGICGNWTMNVAYAGRFGAEAFVTRLRSLAEMETLVAAGIPVVATVAFAEGGLPGAGYDTEGHLLVVRGFTTDGDVVVNDPASHLERSNDAVRVVYDRAAFERVWLGAAAAGVVYVVHPADVPLPEVVDPAEPNW